MGRKSKHISNDDEKFIRENCGELTVSQIAKKRKIPYGNVYNYMVRNNIVARCIRNVAEKKQIEPENNEQLFDPGKFDNWIV